MTRTTGPLEFHSGRVHLFRCPRFNRLISRKCSSCMWSQNTPKDNSFETVCRVFGFNFQSSVSCGTNSKYPPCYGCNVWEGCRELARPWARIEQGLYDRDNPESMTRPEGRKGMATQNLRSEMQSLPKVTDKGAARHVTSKS